MTTDSMTLLGLAEKSGDTEFLTELIAVAESRLRELGESGQGNLTQNALMRNSMDAAMVRAATLGDTKMARLCLRSVGMALKHSKPIDRTLRDYVGDALISAVSQTDWHGKTEEKAKAVARALGLIGKRSGPKYHRYKPVVRDYQLACLARFFCDESGDQIVRDTHLQRAADRMDCSVSTARTAYRRFQANVDDPEHRSGVHSIARLATTRKKHR